jgi:hypothetical protein
MIKIMKIGYWFSKIIPGGNSCLLAPTGEIFLARDWKNAEHPALQINRPNETTVYPSPRHFEVDDFQLLLLKSTMKFLTNCGIFSVLKQTCNI